jgi:hypothetical protein
MALHELEANLLLRPQVHVHYAWLPLDSDALGNVVGAVPAGSELNARTEILANAYRFIRRYNAAAAYSNDKVGYGAGYMDNALEALVTSLQEPMMAGRDVILEILKEIPPADGSPSLE